MIRQLGAMALAAALTAVPLSPSLGQGFGFGGPGMMMGGGCPTIGMMGQGMMGGWNDEWRGRGRGMMGGQPRLGAMIGGRLAYLKSELAITEAQTEAWNGYAEAVEARIESMQAIHASMWETMQQGTALERMDARIASMESMLEAMKALKPATATLYEALSDEQKKQADDLIGLDCGAM